MKDDGDLSGTKLFKVFALKYHSDKLAGVCDDEQLFTLQQVFAICQDGIKVVCLEQGQAMSARYAHRVR